MARFYSQEKRPTREALEIGGMMKMTKTEEALKEAFAGEAVGQQEVHILRAAGGEGGIFPGSQDL
jgi:hypothetical protein